MKSLRVILLAGFAVLSAALTPQLMAAKLTISPATEPLYVRIDSPNLIAFHDYRLAQADGSELILTTLKKTAADQARFAEYPGEVIVLDEDAKVPAGAAVLLLTWVGAEVNATLMRDGKEKSLGAVSRAPLSNHPDYATMRLELDRGSSDDRRDAQLRAKTQMQLYQSLRLVRRYQAKG